MANLYTYCAVCLSARWEWVELESRIQTRIKGEPQMLRRTATSLRPYNSIYLHTRLVTGGYATMRLILIVALTLLVAFGSTMAREHQSQTWSAAPLSGDRTDGSEAVGNTVNVAEASTPTISVLQN